MREKTVFSDAKILIVDDQEFNISLLERILTRKGYTNLRSTQNPLQVTGIFAEFQPDIILLDLHMPEMNGFEVLAQLQEIIHPGEYLPILVLTADITPEAKNQALAQGAKDFLTKPFDRTEVLLRISNLLETRFVYLQLYRQNEILEEKVRERTAELEQAQQEILELLARAAEYRDDVTGHHTRRVGQMAAEVAQMMGLSDWEVEVIRQAAPLHDIGKIGIPDNILLKPGKFTDEEYQQMKHHTHIGANILAGSQFPVLKMAEHIAISHHERWDGAGYPHQLSGEFIPLAGRIVGLVDFFDALTHERPYKQAWTVEATVAEIKRLEGEHFDPSVVGAFLKVLEHKSAASGAGAELPPTPFVQEG